eukprot:4737293-Heterocapsa_arctica.AAC.1
MDIPTRSMGASHARKQFEFLDNPYVRKIIWKLQKGLASTGCLGTGDSEKGDMFGSLNIVISYRKDVDELVRAHVPRGESWEKEKLGSNNTLKPMATKALISSINNLAL